jgi:restriction endonuclease S subunit
MAVCYTTRSSELDEDSVIDSQFYDPLKIKYLEIFKRGNPTVIKNEFDEITDLSSDREKVTFPVILYDLPDSLGNLFTDGLLVSSFSDIGSTKKVGFGGDFAISRLRHYLKEFGVLPPGKITYLLSTEYIVLRGKSQTPSELLLPFFLLDQIQYIFEKSQRGSNHPRLANKDILNFPLPNFLIKIKGKIQEIIQSSIIQYNLSKSLYPEAEQELLERMKWDKVDTKHILDYSTTSKNIFSNERVDPEFYQPKFKNLIRHLRKAGSVKLGNFCPVIKRGISPQYYEKGEVFIVNSQNLEATGLIDISNLEKTSLDYFNEERNKDARLTQFDVLTYATGAYIGRTNVWLENAKAIAGIDCIISQPQKNICNPTYLSLFLNSFAGLMQSDQKASGSAQRHLYPKDLREYEIFIPQNKNGKPDLEWQEKLANKIIQAYEAKKEAKQKLQRAKELVEAKIEELLD